ncbi:adenylosuccinate synthase [Effusibacillus lacus]|uniref:Adenylosuccinate synthetase n=1 Tax=Effusibacillus lacus TaxID=1348429 RepID=A0A292YL53_9BACL|nr:adenylosuccinate synthase [Effusibacillus lacus]TCS75156.1 adenylosuccinate synthetase [Effusibacillus lacus]GAX89104.1 adenylosuccinate synthase [Effusibacillus lacus]
MATLVVVGTQWGDEGKGKITDFLAEKAGVVARYQGGNNAGHTISIQGKEFKLHLIPSGIFYPEKICVIGNGMVVNPKALVDELTYLKNNGVSADNLRISDRAHVVMPYHIKLDELEEESKGSNKIGTTRKGIGPAYMDKAARVGIRIIDLLDPEEFAAKLKRNLEEKNRVFDKLYGAEGFDYEAVYREYLGYAEVIRPYVTDTSVVLNEAIDAGKDVLFEGAQASMLDIDQGTYPYVTSSNPVAGGVCIGAGVGPTKIDKVIGVVKAYSTRVGDGPFPTELLDETGQFIRETGREYGTTTGRPRRVGWFDSLVVRHARRVSGLDGMAITRLDILTGLKELKICTAYRHNGEILKEFPTSLKVLAKCEPVYETLPGWDEDITGVRSYEDLPANTRAYIEKIAEVTGVPLAIFSIGPNREQTVPVTDIY